MDREYCLSFLIALVGGAALLACGWWPVADVRVPSARNRERITWWRIWLPVAPALAVGRVGPGNFTPSPSQNRT
jgi:hypothetical protein